MNIYRHIAHKADLEREYSPSSLVGDLAPVLAEYAARSAEARAATPGWRTEAYGAHPDEALDIFPAPSTLQGGPPRPALVYIHGGYWQALGKGDHSFPAPGLARHDMGYAAVNYGLAPAATLGEMVERCRNAVAWIAANGPPLGIDPQRICLAGSSAGAHLAAMVALGGRRSPVRGLILLSGVYDLRPLPLTYVNDKVGMTADEALRNSPLLLVDAHRGALPPTLVVHGDNETAEFKRQSAEFAEAVARKGVLVERREIAGRNHFDLVFDLGEPDTVLGSLTLQALVR